MKINTQIWMASTALALVISAPALAQQTDLQESAESTEAEEITVIGSRGKPRTDLERPVPVDVVDTKELAATGQTDLGQQVQFTSPSFNSAKYGVNGATNFADPASLRGLAPDQVLLLINGHRRHQFSALNLNVSPGLGTVVSDLNSIPTAAVERIEVLRDGAAAQYGSDAIAGIVNLALKNDDEGGSMGITVGLNKEGDGFTMKGSINHGLSLDRTVVLSTTRSNISAPKAQTGLTPMTASFIQRHPRPMAQPARQQHSPIPRQTLVQIAVSIRKDRL